MKESEFYTETGEGVSCTLCAHRCSIAEGKTGFCGVRKNIGGRLFSLVYGKPIAQHIDPIEKKPLYHFLPNSRTFSIATVGCNMGCMHCQNFDISQSPKTGEVKGFDLGVEEVVEKAVSNECLSISYTYTEPTVFFEYAQDISATARENGLRNVFVSNGYMSELSAKQAVSFLDADNIDLKSFSDSFYRRYCKASLDPVLETIKTMVNAGVWIELTTLLIPGLNDTKQEIGDIASFIHDELGDYIPWHISSFHPDYQLTNIPATDRSKVLDACRIGSKAGLKYVYAGNIVSESFSDTICAECNNILVRRQGYLTKVEGIVKGGRCSNCNSAVEGVYE